MGKLKQNVADDHGMKQARPVMKNQRIFVQHDLFVDISSIVEITVEISQLLR
jgi:hypothetical protein